MSAVEGVALIALLGIVLYAIFGGADFGGGVWDLFATGPRRELQRTAITEAIGPVWESNHVWLILLIVTLFTCFPPAFADIATGLNTPLAIALVGIVLRGSAFTFRNYASDDPRVAYPWSVVFGSASIIAPFFFGAAAGGIATGSYDWTSPFALFVGLLAVALCAQLAAVFILRETQDPQVRLDFRHRAIAATIAVWILGIPPALLARSEYPQLFAAFTAPVALIAIAVAIVLGIGVMICVARGAYVAGRIMVGGEVLAVLVGWFGAQAPALVPGHLTFESAASPQATLVAFLIVVAIGVVVLIPSLYYLFSVFKGPARTLTRM
jgi:cytochrome bd ubiquinol oxidase subunit II